MATKRDVLKEHLREWLGCVKDKKRRGQITEVVCAALKLHPKSVPRSFRRLRMRDSSVGTRRGRKTVYGPAVTAALLTVWEAGDKPCGELLHPMIFEYVEILRRDDDWKHGEEATRLLLAMSERTVKRRVLGLAKKYGSRGYATTKPGILKPAIPIFKGPWKDVLPGNGQVDTVAHCGERISGDYAFTVNYTDAATYWVVPRAQWNKGQAATLQSLETVYGTLPFPLLGLHPDSGSEFINWLAKSWCGQKGIELTRSEPGKKNDNMFVEERNGHVVRRYLGYVRYDAEETVTAMNELYGILSTYLNHFKAVKRCISKERVGAKYVRRYEKQAKTPYQRVLAHPSVSDDVKERLRQEHERLNPLRLKREVDTLIQKVYKQQKAARTESTA